MSEQKQVQVTLDELILKQEDVQQFYVLAEELPHKYAKQVLGLLEGKIKEQLEAKVKKLQDEYQAELQKLELEKKIAETEVTTLQAVHGE